MKLTKWVIVVFKSGKKKPTLKLLIIALGLSPLLSVGLADSGNIYLGLGAGQSDLNPEPSKSLINITDSHGDAYKIFAGYNLNDFISLEGFYSDLGNGEITATLPTTPLPTISNIAVEHKNFGLDLLLRFPDNKPGFSGFLKLGLSMLDLKGGKGIIAEPESILPTLGLGLEYQLQTGIFFRGDYSFIDSNTSYATLNIGKRFGVAPPPAVNPISTLLDTDRDGIINSRDKCPNTPLGAKVSNAGCPIETKTAPLSLIPSDTDTDGVLDENDNCPRSKPGAIVNQHGCIEITDSDQDGIYDHIDQCPDTPKSDVDSVGCPVIQHLSKVLVGAYFLYDSDQLTSPAKKYLNKVIIKLKSYPDSSIQIIGHTDNKGSKERNLQLSRKRAKSVFEYLVSGGINPKQMRYEGKGENKPLVPNNSHKNRAKNRRVELIVSERVESKRF